MLYDELVPQGEWLCHHGVKGMKWGVRRYQNEDGSLTEKGKKRYLINNGDTLSKKAYKYRDLKGNKININAYHVNKIKSTADKIPLDITPDDKKKLQMLKKEYNKYHKEWIQHGKEINKRLLNDHTISGIDEHDTRFFKEMRLALGEKKYEKHNRAEYNYLNERLNIVKKSVQKYMDEVGAANNPILEGYTNNIYGRDLARELLDRIDKQI